MAQVTLPYTLTPGTPENVSNLMSNLTALRDGVNTIDTAQIAAGAVTSAKLASSAVDSTALASGAVTAVKLAQGAKGLIYLGSASPSASSAINIDSVFSSTYTNYRIVFGLKAGTGTPAMYFKLRASGTNTSGSLYKYVTMYAQADGTGWNVQYNSTSAAETSIVPVQSNSRAFGCIDVGAPYLSEETTLLYEVNRQGLKYTGASAYQATTAYDGFTLYPASSSLTGYVAVYAYTE